MSILTDIYKIPEASASDFQPLTLLNSAYTKQFTIDIDSFTELSNKNLSILWNFGDPFSTTNEILINDLVNSSTEHTFTYEGTYTINCIINADGILFHLEKKLTITN